MSGVLGVSNSDKEDNEGARSKKDMPASSGETPAPFLPERRVRSSVGRQVGCFARSGQPWADSRERKSAHRSGPSLLDL